MQASFASRCCSFNGFVLVKQVSGLQEIKMLAWGSTHARSSRTYNNSRKCKLDASTQYGDLSASQIAWVRAGQTPTAVAKSAREGYK